MLRHEGDETHEREVIQWLKKNQIPSQRFMSLPLGDKEALCGQLSVPKRPASDKQLRDLYRKLCLPDHIGGRGIDPVEFMPHEELDRFFTSVAPSETLSYLEKF